MVRIYLGFYLIYIYIYLIIVEEIVVTGVACFFGMGCGIVIYNTATAVHQPYLQYSQN